MPPVYNVEYLGQGKWLVVKTCSINAEWNGAWYFNENTDDFDWNQEYFDNGQAEIQNK